jgi:hypothetical protein
MRNKKLIRINEIRGQLLGLEMALKLIEDDLDVIMDRLIILSRLEADLIYNIDLHRSGKVITVINEYRKSIEDLSTVQKEIIKHRNLKDKLKNKMENNFKSYDYYINELENTYNDLKNEQVILVFNKKDDNGGK